MGRKSPFKLKLITVDRHGRRRTGWREWLYGGRAVTPDGQCWACGYDLRGIDSSVCPECGHDIDAASDMQEREDDHAAD